MDRFENIGHKERLRYVFHAISLWIFRDKIDWQKPIVELNAHEKGDTEIIKRLVKKKARKARMRTKEHTVSAN